VPARPDSQLDGYDLLLREIRRNLSRHLDVIVFVDGDRGSGKSSLSLRLAWDIDPLWRKRPDLAANAFTIFSPMEYVLLVAYLLRGGDSLYRGRFVVYEEAGATGTLGSAAAVQNMRSTLEVMRQWQICLIINLPLKERMRDLMYEVAHFSIWSYRSDHEQRVILARWKQRYRDEQRVAFVNPVLLQKGRINPSVPGLGTRVRWAPEEIWEPYIQAKQEFFEELNRRAIERNIRVSKKRGDLAAGIARQHFYEIAGVDIEEPRKDVLAEMGW